MKKMILFTFACLTTQINYAQRTVKELESVVNSVSEEKFTENFFINTSNFTVYALSHSSLLREIEQTALLYGVNLKIKEYIKSNKIYALDIEIITDTKTIKEHFDNGNAPLNKIDLEFYKNADPTGSVEDRKTKISIKKDRNNLKNGNIPRVIFLE